MRRGGQKYQTDPSVGKRAAARDRKISVVKRRIEKTWDEFCLGRNMSYVHQPRAGGNEIRQLKSNFFPHGPPLIPWIASPGLPRAPPRGPHVMLEAAVALPRTAHARGPVIHSLHPASSKELPPRCPLRRYQLAASPLTRAAAPHRPIALGRPETLCCVKSCTYYRAKSTAFSICFPELTQKIPRRRHSAPAHAQQAEGTPGEKIFIRPWSRSRFLYVNPHEGD